LRGLFAATDDDALEAVISERTREIEEQTARLQATIDGLHRREEQAARLRSAVEEMLRLGSAELDERKRPHRIQINSTRGRLSDRRQ